MSKLEVIILLFLFLFFLSSYKETESNIQKEIEILKANIEEIHQENIFILKKLKIK